MKGDACGFLHQWDTSRMPVCKNLIRFGECKDIGCPYKHSLEEIKECNMYQLGLCIYGPSCRFRHVKMPGEGSMGRQQREAAEARVKRAGIMWQVRQQVGGWVTQVWQPCRLHSGLP